MANFKHNTSNYFTSVLVFFAFIITVLVIRQEFFLSEPQKENEQLKNTNYQLENWQQLKLKDHPKVSEDSPIQILEFLDYQCPSCKRIQPDIHFIEQKYGDKISVTYIHVPLDYHKFAFEAAVAAECARKQNKFKAYHNLLFINQYTIGSLPFDSLALKVGVNDIAAFNTCIKTQATAHIVQSDYDLAQELQLKSVPTFIINEKLISGAMPRNQLDDLVKEALERRRSRR